jgi:P-type conjugative transfer ATPase TrbB
MTVAGAHTTAMSHRSSERSRRIAEKLERELGAVVFACLRDPQVVDIILNPDGGIWVERLGGAPQRLGEMPSHQAEALIATVAAELQTVVTAERPILECELPIDGSRFTAVIPPIVTAPAFAIRRRASQIITLADYVSAGVLTCCRAACLARAIDERRNIVIAGGTGSGKTTLANALIAQMAAASPDDRLVILEDTAEIQCAAPNAVILRATSTVTLQRLVRTTMRLSPRRIIVGEVRGAEALEMLKAWNTGHPGGIATIHANSAADALARLEDLVREATEAPMQRTIAAAVHLIVFIAKTATGRQVEEVVRVDGVRGETYLTRQHQE